MSEAAASNRRMLRDTVLYMLAKSIEGIVGILTISVLSHLFATDEGGRYTLWNTTVTIFAMLSIQWLAQSAGRYLNDYELKNDKRTFYSTVFASWLKINVCAALVAALLGLVLSRLPESEAPGFVSFVYGDDFTVVFILAAAYFFTYNTSQLLITLLSIKRKAFTNLIISVFSAAGKLLLIIVFSRLFGARIAVVFLSYVLCEIIVIIIGLVRLSALSYIKPGCASRELSAELGRYGAPLVGNLAATTLLNSSDRYIIQNYYGKSQQGVYTMNYTVASAVFSMLQAAMMRGSYPTILKTYAGGDRALTERLISQAVRNYLLVAVPSVVGIGVLAKPLAELIFAASWTSGYPVMVWAALGMLFLGLTEYSNKPWELSAKTGVIFRNSLISGLANVIINLICVPRFGYMAAAYSTFLSFLIYFCLSKYGSSKLMKWRLTLKTYASIIGCALFMGACLIGCIRLVGVTGPALFVYVPGGVLIYGVSLALTGELREEIRAVKRAAEKYCGKC